ncbi:TPA: DUF2584 family protein [Clostridium perfringens]|uniref:DUF2584 family protein n=1 Tax=Clostridium perfringens TaxID=1502 RepID=UPI0028E12857|nr:DUF2584 family protein [Clostridium perfringens]MDM0848106.1 DUF2584 family protein [Clostridium perfringens]MDM0859431.1 DUF2584 family protein [Clostridium perfringens]MDT9332901.1 DUF2584 family protein [Clostridium perfringens]
MGVLYEINWYLVTSNKNDILKIDKYEYKLEKSGKRIYPIDCDIPLIVKEFGCIGLVKVKKIEVDKDKTVIIYSFVKKYDFKSEIARHYYELYLSIKNNQK